MGDLFNPAWRPPDNGVPHVPRHKIVRIHCPGFYSGILKKSFVIRRNVRRFQFPTSKTGACGPVYPYLNVREVCFGSGCLERYF